MTHPYESSMEFEKIKKFSHLKFDYGLFRVLISPPMALWR